MARLKFLVFAAVALALWVYHLALVAPAVSSHAVQQASASVLGAPAAVALQIEAQPSELQAAVVKLASSPAVLNPGPKGAKEPPTADRFNAIRTVVAEALAEPQRAVAVIGLSNEVGTLVAQGPGDPAAPPEGFELAPITQALGAPAVVTVFGAPHLFYAVPMLISDRNEVRTGGSVFVGLPMLPDAKALVGSVAGELKLGAVGVVAGGAVVASAGTLKGQLPAAAKLPPGHVAAIAEGPVGSFGPINLPMFTDSKPLEIGLHQAIEGTPYSVVAVTSVRASLESLAGYQKFALAGLIALLALTIIIAVLIGQGGDESVARMVAPPPIPAPPPAVVAARKEEEPAPLAMAEQAEAPEASPDDFQFPDSAPPPAAPTASATTAIPPMPDDNPVQGEPISNPPPDLFSAPPPPDLFANAPPAYVPKPASASSPSSGTLQQAKFSVPPPTRAPASLNDDDEDEGGRTVAYPVFNPHPAAAPDSFAAASAGQPEPPPPDANADYNPDATRVAAVPAELIKAARSGVGTTGERPALKPQFAAMPKVQSVAPVAPVGGSDEDRHFQDVFRDFVSTRERCGEAADGLTFEKFRAKLMKNKDQLVLKYSCRTVRFQVYVKDGKAALKATPVKD